ncbi:MAG: hypothetical protein H0V86_13700 [Chloroflexia bacterium]|nr:hypothetical protein [Chloroflexia bacterium]
MLARFVRGAALAAIAFGLLRVGYGTLELFVVPHESTTATLQTGSHAFASGLSLLAAVLLLWALVGLYIRQSDAAGTFGLVAFVVAFFGAALVVGISWLEMFVLPVLAKEAPQLVGQEQLPGSLGVAYLLSFALFGLGMILFGIATLLAHVFPRWPAALLIVSIPATIFLPATPGSVWEAIGPIMIGIAIAAQGWYATRMPQSGKPA